MIKLRIILVFLVAAAIGWTWGTLAPPQPVEAASELISAALIEEQLNCYGFVIGSPAPLISEMPFFVNSSGGGGVSGEELSSAVNAAVAEWESYAGDVFGSGSVDETATFEYGDGLNTVTFNALDEPRIANTSVRVRPEGGSWWIAEWDIVLNSSFSWGDELQGGGVVDLQGILTHELGHALGLDDLSNAFCVDQTMYYGAETGDVSKLRDLGEQDLEGLRLLYQINQ